jgi:hypothetical protein
MMLFMVMRLFQMSVAEPIQQLIPRHLQIKAFVPERTQCFLDDCSLSYLLATD